MIITTRADRRMNINNYSHWVYGLYLNYSLVYVGVTSDPERRRTSHANTKKFDEMRLIKGFSSRDRAEQYENTCIKQFNDLINIVSLEPRPVGFNKINPPSITSDDMKAWSGDRASEFDFGLLKNKSISRRLKWESKHGNKIFSQVQPIG